MKGKLKALLAAAGIAASAGAAQAAPITFDGLYSDSSEIVRINVNNGQISKRVYADAFNVSSGTDSFIAWCVDLYQSMHAKGTTQSYTEVAAGSPLQVSQAEADNINRLFTNNLTTALSSAVGAAAFQVALWEIVYDNGNFNLGSGTFRMSDNTAVLNQATTWLANLGDDAGTYDLTFLYSANSQDLVTGELNPVPLPAGMVLLVSAFGLMATRRRKG